MKNRFSIVHNVMPADDADVGYYSLQPHCGFVWGNVTTSQVFLSGGSFH
jgi:hypothetical protein